MEKNYLRLVNRDTTPENLISYRGKFVGLVDPVPSLHNGTRYGSLFVYIYQFLLPALSDAPRYARHRFQQFAPIMTDIAQGYLVGYCQHDQALKAALNREYFYWGLSMAADYYQILQGEFGQEMYLRTGGRPVLTKLIGQSLAMLGQE